MKTKHIDRKQLEKRRLKAGTFFEKKRSQVWVSEHFKVSRAAVCQWYKMWKKSKTKGLLSKGHPGFASQLTEKKKSEFKSIILKGPIASGYKTDFWTIDRLCEIARKKLKVKLGYTRIWNTVVSLGFSCQKPERLAREQDAKAVKTWKQKTFPELKKMG